ncbi:hypothetical protein ACFFTK_28480 [Pseudonocardia petroleophila]|uniref:Uncharacterized protein n=1 Tax=Pseudonocardia petroleophila TaxID=37331 RepID=A0A7G7MMP7_9PSEU|nr:hypothetical protein [Pseudonocardia petroleophila]QNG54058.1 hypothetical protein H6H00_09220 [Pseudonocardia petroleophila]
MPRSRLLRVAAVWVAATLFGLLVAATTRIGPIVASLSYNHGVHLGDLLAFAAAYLVAAAVTVSEFERHQNRK